MTTQTQLLEKWFRSEAKLVAFLQSLGYTAQNGRIYKDGTVLPLPALYGQYSQQSWFVHYPIQN